MIHRGYAFRSRWPVLCLLLLMAACQPQPVPASPEPVTLQLVAADSCEPVVASAAEAYSSVRPWVTVRYDVYNTALAEQVLREGAAEMALLTWLSDSGEAEDSLWIESLGRDGVAVIVHPESPIAEIGLAQLREVFAGRLQDWGGATITAVSREDGSGTRAAFDSVVLDGVSPSLSAVVMPSSGAVVEYVARTPGAIGYVAVEHLNSSVRALPIEGILPTREVIDAGQYPLWRQLFLVSHGEPTGEAREFAQWLIAQGVKVPPVVPEQP